MFGQPKLNMFTKWIELNQSFFTRITKWVGLGIRIVISSTFETDLNMTLFDLFANSNFTQFKIERLFQLI